MKDTRETSHHESKIHEIQGTCTAVKPLKRNGKTLVRICAPNLNCGGGREKEERKEINHGNKEKTKTIPESGVFKD